MYIVLRQAVMKSANSAFFIDKQSMVRIILVNNDLETLG